MPPRRRVPARFLEADGLPRIPPIAVEVLRLCREEETTLDELARTLSRDPELSARILRFANSSHVDLGSDVGSLDRAALVLGMKSIQLLALAFSISAGLPRGSARSRFDHARYWRRSVVRAVASRSLARLARTMAEDEAFLCGLLAELGQLVLAESLGPAYEPVLARAGASAQTASIERDLLGFDHADVAGALLDSWRFPAAVSQALFGLHHPEELPAEIEPHLSTLLDVLLAGSHLTDLLTGEDPRSSLRCAEDACQEAFGIEPAALHAFVLSLEPSVRETSELLGVELAPGASFDELLSEARAEIPERGPASREDLDDERAALAHRTRRARLQGDASRVDPVTGVLGRAAFDAFLGAEIELRLSGALDGSLGCLWIAIDRLEQADATLGAGTRNEVLRWIGATLAPLVRRVDLLARVDEGHFAVLLGDATLSGVRALADRLRAAVEEAGLDSPRGRIGTSITLGGACLGTVDSWADGTTLAEAALRCLERARAEGGNRVLVDGFRLGA